MTKVRCMPQGNLAQQGSPARIAVNGYALREIRILAGLTIAQLAREISDAPTAVKSNSTYINHLEHGRKATLSPTLFKRIVDALGIDRRSLLANPHAGQVAA